MFALLQTLRAAGAVKLTNKSRFPWDRCLLFFVGGLPFVWLVTAAICQWLGANPAEALIRGSGDWTIRMLCMTLAITPLKDLLTLPILARYRRQLGLWAFFYATTHLVLYFWLDLEWGWDGLYADLLKRPFIWMGMLTWVTLLVLAVTTPPVVIRQLGGRRWRQIHRLVYVSIVLALLHFVWMKSAKNDFSEVQWYLAVAALLLGWRLHKAFPRYLPA
jgi:methionine sulfoxide reductase heme-binding subunit